MADVSLHYRVIIRAHTYIHTYCGYTWRVLPAGVGKCRVGKREVSGRDEVLVLRQMMYTAAQIVASSRRRSAAAVPAAAAAAAAATRMAAGLIRSS